MELARLLYREGPAAGIHVRDIVLKMASKFRDFLDAVFSIPAFRERLERTSVDLVDLPLFCVPDEKGRTCTEYRDYPKSAAAVIDEGSYYNVLADRNVGNWAEPSLPPPLSLLISSSLADPFSEEKSEPSTTLSTSSFLRRRSSESDKYYPRTQQKTRRTAGATKQPAEGQPDIHLLNPLKAAAAMAVRERACRRKEKPDEEVADDVVREMRRSVEKISGGNHFYKTAKEGELRKVVLAYVREKRARFVEFRRKLEKEVYVDVQGFTEDTFRDMQKRVKRNMESLTNEDASFTFISRPTTETGNSNGNAVEAFLQKVFSSNMVLVTGFKEGGKPEEIFLPSHEMMKCRQRDEEAADMGEDRCPNIREVLG